MTNKLYYQDQYLTTCDTFVTDIGQNFIELQDTVFFPEGGGQEADRGVIIINDINFMVIDCQKANGQALTLEDFPFILIGGVVRHFVSNIEDLTQISVGAKATCQLDVERRAKLTL